VDLGHIRVCAVAGIGRASRNRLEISMASRTTLALARRVPDERPRTVKPHQTTGALTTGTGNQVITLSTSPQRFARPPSISPTRKDVA